MFDLSNIVPKIWNTLGLPTPKVEILGNVGTYFLTFSHICEGAFEF
jgi:hypothetical protein